MHIGKSQYGEKCSALTAVKSDVVELRLGVGEWYAPNGWSGFRPRALDTYLDGSCPR